MKILQFQRKTEQQIPLFPPHGLLAFDISLLFLFFPSPCRPNYYYINNTCDVKDHTLGGANFY